MSIDEMDLIGDLKEVDILSDDAFDRARTLLNAAITAEAEPEVIELVRHPKRRRRAIGIRAGVAAAVAAATIAVVAQSTGTTPKPTATLATQLPRRAGQAILVRLASTALASPAPAGDATLVVRSQAVNGGPPILGADLYTDSGKYYYAPTESGLPAQIVAGNNRGDGVFARELTAAEQAATGNLANAAIAMETAQDLATNPRTGELSPSVLWQNSLDALVAGSGNPTVRAGVMRLIATIPEVAVAQTTVGGEPVLRITATFPYQPKCPNALPAGLSRTRPPCAGTDPGRSEQLTLDAATGIPVSFSGGTIGQPPAPLLSYLVKRVELSQVARGHLVTKPTTFTPDGS